MPPLVVKYPNNTNVRTTTSPPSSPKQLYRKQVPLGRPPRSRSDSGSSGGGGSPLRRPELIRRQSSNSSINSAHSGGNTTSNPNSSNNNRNVHSPTKQDAHVALALEQCIQFYGSAYHTAVAPLYIRLGNIHFRAAQYKFAADYYKKAVQCDPGTGDGDCHEEHAHHLADAYANLGTVFWTTGQIPKAIEVLQQALAAYELLDHEHRRRCARQSNSQDSQERGDDDDHRARPAPSAQVANVHHQLGLAYCLCQDYSSAFESLSCARQLREARGDHIAVAKTFDAMGKVLYCQGNLDAALLHHQQALAILHDNNNNKQLSTNNNNDNNVIPTLQLMAHVLVHKQEWRAALGVYSELLLEQKALFLANAEASPTKSSNSGAATQSPKALHETLLSAAVCYEQLGFHDEGNHCRKEASLIAQACGLLEHDENIP